LFRNQRSQHAKATLLRWLELRQAAGALVVHNALATIYFFRFDDLLQTTLFADQPATQMIPPLANGWKVLVEAT
jgi:hypothetical protein